MEARLGPAAPAPLRRRHLGVLIDPVARDGFTAAADTYERGRPAYPTAAVDALVRELGIGPGVEVLDLAAGTGKLTHQLVGLGATVVAVEPLAEMRRHISGATVLEGTAEAIPLPDASVDVVTVAQAFHWFDRDAALAEVGRVLRPGGGLGLVWNGRDRSVSWVVELDELIKAGATIPFRIDIDWLAVLTEWGVAAGSEQVQWDMELDEETLVADVRSRSYVAVQPAAQQEAVEASIRDFVAGFPALIRLPSVTDVFWCRTSS